MSHYPFRGSFYCTCPYGVSREYRNQYGEWMKDTHEGIDLKPSGSDSTIVAIASGTVAKVRDTGSSGYGISVYISHDDGETSSLYGHLSSYAVEVGQKVKAGQKIGVMGSTGNSTGPHLHLSVYDKNKNAHWSHDTIDPSKFLNLPYDVLYKQQPQQGGSVQYPVHSGNTQDVEQTDEKVRQYLSTQNIYQVVGAGSFGGYQLFGRRYNIIVSDEQGNSINVSNLSCEFEINKTAYLQLNVSKITIYNLAPITENAILTDGALVIVQAGYDERDHFGTIFRGRIYQKIKRKINSVTYALDLICMSNQRFFAYSVNSFSLSANQNAQDALLGSIRNTVFEGTATEVGSVSMSSIVYPRGKVVYGQTKKVLSDLSKNDSTSFYFDDETINTLDLTSLPQDNEVIYLNPKSGMIGLPQEIPVQTGGSGIQAQSLLNPLIHLQNLIHVDNSSIIQREYDVESGQLSRRYFLDKNGLYRVIKLTHRGTTRGQDWFTEIQAVSQSGGIAGLLQSSIDSAL